MASGPEGLEEGEQLVATANASFRGATAASSRAIFALGSARARARAYQQWRVDVEALGFPTAGPEMVLGLTDRRLLICRTTFWMGRPASIEGSIPLQRLANVAVTRHGAVTGLALALTNGQVVEFEAMRARRLRRFAARIRDVVDGG